MYIQLQLFACRIGDRILKINDSSVIGKSPTQVQRLLSGVKWREEVKILAMPAQETVAFHFSEMANAGVIVMKVLYTVDVQMICCNLISSILSYWTCG